MESRSTRFVWTIITILLVSLCWLVTYQLSFADTIVSQTTNSASDTHFLPSSASGYYYQDIGFVSGAITAITFQYEATTTVPSGNVLIAIYQGTGAPTGGSTFIEQNQIAVSSHGAGSYERTVTFAGTSLNPAVNTQVLIDWNTVSQSNISLKGCSPSCYSAGALNNHPSVPAASISDMYFVVQGAIGTTTSEGITAITSPTNQSTTANNTPTFSYTYYTVHAYDRAGIVLTDMTTGQSINTAAASSTNSSSGSHTYSQPFGVTTGHLYNWKPVLYDTTGALTPIYGPQYTFFAVNTSQYQSLPSQLQSPFSTSSIYSQNTGLVSSSTASSTNYTQTFSFAASSSLGLCFAYFPDDIRNAMSIKFPFSYLCDLQTLISQMVNGDGNARGNLQIGLGTVGTTTLIDKQAVSAIGAVQEVKRVAGYALYLSTAMLTLWAVVSIL